MRRKYIDQFIHQSQIAGHLSGNDVAKRIATAALMAMVAVLAGFEVAAIFTLAVILLFEAIVYPLNIRASRLDEPINLTTASLIWMINWASMLPFLAFSVILSTSDVLPFVLAGFIWIFGIFVHVSNTFGLLPVYNWSQMIPAFVSGYLMLQNIALNPAHSGTKFQWIMTGILLSIYIGNTFGTMNLQKKTHQALARAREQANARLVELERLSRSDSLTGLMNRRAFDEVLQSMMHQHMNKQGVTAFLMDLDGFKPINDTYSHAAGDVVIRTVAERLKELSGRDGRVARLGGDEFAVLKTSITSAQAAREFGRLISARLEEPISYGQKALSISASIGIARQSSETNTPNSLLSGADQAMFLAKEDPEGRAKIYDKAAFPVRPTLEDRQVLIDAMNSGEIKPYYQPKICLATDEIIGFEALSRWEHPVDGLRAPSAFLPQINELGLQGEFMIHTAEIVMRDIATLVAEGLDPGQVSINIAEVTLATHSARDELFSVIDRYPAIRPHLTFEITEDIFISRASDFIQDSIVRFRRAGVRISLDDFGTGFASLQHLKDLEFDELKLDTGFVRDLGVDPAAHVLIEGVVMISKGLNVELIAEGVETAQQREMLLNMGCRNAQGFFYGAALPLNESHLRLMAQPKTTSKRDTKDVA